MRFAPLYVTVNPAPLVVLLKVDPIKDSFLVRFIYIVDPIKDSFLVRFAPLYVTVNPIPLVKPPWV